MIEALTYRLGAHTTADDPTRYREDAEVAEWRKKDPIERFRRHLEARGLWTKEWEDALRQDASAEVEAAVATAEKLTPPEPDEIFRYTFQEPTPQLRAQSQTLREALRSERGK